MLERYTTILYENQDELIEKKSRFIATIKPICTEEEAIGFIEEISKKYRDARHNVFAYSLGLDQPIERYSDDGEPSGTAGMPILEVIRGNKLKNVAIVVTRYFGGTLLGTGGLVRAYGGSAKIVIDTAIKVDKILYHLIDVKVDYTYTGKLENEIRNNKHLIYETEYLDRVTYKVLVEFKEIDKFSGNMVDITNSNVEINNQGLYYGYIINNKTIIEKLDHFR